MSASPPGPPRLDGRRVLGLDIPVVEGRPSIFARRVVIHALSGTIYRCEALVRDANGVSRSILSPPLPNLGVAKAAARLLAAKHAVAVVHVPPTSPAELEPLDPSRSSNVHVLRRP